jgi:ribosomal protein S28E/S33
VADAPLLCPARGSASAVQQLRSRGSAGESTCIRFEIQRGRNEGSVAFVISR